MLLEIPVIDLNDFCVIARLELEWGRGRIFDMDIAQMFQRVVADAKHLKVVHLCLPPPSRIDKYHAIEISISGLYTIGHDNSFEKTEPFALAAAHRPHPAISASPAQVQAWT